MLTDSFRNKLRKLCKSILNEEIPVDINDIQRMLLSKLSKRKMKKQNEKLCYVENFILYDLSSLYNGDSETIFVTHLLPVSQ